MDKIFRERKVVYSKAYLLSMTGGEGNAGEFQAALRLNGLGQQFFVIFVCRTFIFNDDIDKGGVYGA
ncbi:MAG TPA: hypothetical protein VN963_01690 [bacterium]|nr:hypothetical protein [bacterium]